MSTLIPLPLFATKPNPKFYPKNAAVSRPAKPLHPGLKLCLDLPVAFQSETYLPTGEKVTIYRQKAKN